MFKLDGPFLNDWVEVAQRKVNGNELNSWIVCGKKKIGNSWYFIVVEDMTDEKYDVFGNHLAGGVKWRYGQHRGQLCIQWNLY